MILPITEATMEHADDGLAETIRARRRDLGLSQEELGALSGASERWIRDLEHGKSTVRLDKLRAVLDALGLQLRAERRSPS